MASVLFGGGVSLIVGKHGGSAFQRRKGGNLMRQKVMPVNPIGVRNTAMRRIIANLSVNWSNGLTSGQIASWNTFASSNPVMNRVGQVTNLSGQQMFFKLNARLNYQGYPTIVVPPASGAVGTVSSCVFVADRSGVPVIHFTIGIGTPSGSDVAIVKISPSLSMGRSYVSSNLRTLIAQIPSATLFNVYPEWGSNFGIAPATTGQQLIARVHILNTTTGVVSAEQQFNTPWI